MGRRINRHPVSLSAHAMNQKHGQMRWAWAALSRFLSPEDQVTLGDMITRTSARLQAEHEAFKVQFYHDHEHGPR
jgi:hypothetical protein